MNKTRFSKIPRISNGTARRIFLDRHALAEAPVGSAKGLDLLNLIERIGFVQVDSINTVCRAHHKIIFARRQSYKQGNLTPLLERDHSLFEHWTHDASIIPTKFFPYWRLRFERDRERLRQNWQAGRRAGFEAKFDEILKHVSDHGPVTSGEVGAGEKRMSGGWWDWHPSKTALEYLWRTGALSVTRREGFRKVYDLTERVIPAANLRPQPTEEQTIDWACNSALDRLGFATSGEIAAFWDLVRPAEAKTWCERAVRSCDIIPVEIGTAEEGSYRLAYARPDLLELAEHAPYPTTRLRVLSPFDPALRDRKRTERLFGFHYRIEVFVPAPKRRYGYYVFPVLEGDRLIGRMDMKCHRGDGRLHVNGFWPEPGIRFGKGRLQRLEAELSRIAKFTGSTEVTWETGWLKA